MLKQQLEGLAPQLPALEEAASVAYFLEVRTAPSLSTPSLGFNIWTLMGKCGKRVELREPKAASAMESVPGSEAFFTFRRLLDFDVKRKTFALETPSILSKVE